MVVIPDISGSPVWNLCWVLLYQGVSNLTSVVVLSEKIDGSQYIFGGPP